MRRLAWVGLVLFGLVLLRLVVPPAVAFAHFRSTPTFREWVHTHAVDDSLWRAEIPEGVEVATELPWRSSAGEPRARAGQWVSSVLFAHGDEVLLDLEFEVRLESRHVEDWREAGVPSEAFEGLAARVTRSRLDPDFHAVVVLSIPLVGPFPVLHRTLLRPAAGLGGDVLSPALPMQRGRSFREGHSSATGTPCRRQHHVEHLRPDASGR